MPSFSVGLLPVSRSLEVRSPPHPACLPAVTAPLCAGRGAARALTEAKGRPAARLLCPSECPQAASLRPTASERAHRPRPTQPAAPGLAGGPPASAPAARPLAPHGSAGCRQRGCRLLASTASRSCTQRADEAPEVAADRSLSGRCRLRCSRPAEPRLLCAQRARGAAAPHATAPSHPLQPGGQRSHRTTEDRGSRQSASMSARHTRPYRRRRANAAAQRRSGLRQLSLTVGLADRRACAE